MGRLIEDVLSCPNCEGDSRLQFLPMLDGTVYGQCPCGYTWETEQPKVTVH